MPRVIPIQTRTWPWKWGAGGSGRRGNSEAGNPNSLCISRPCTGAPGPEGTQSECRLHPCPVQLPGPSQSPPPCPGNVASAQGSRCPRVVIRRLWQLQCPHASWLLVGRATLRMPLLPWAGQQALPGEGLVWVSSPPQPHPLQWLLSAQACGPCTHLYRVRRQLLVFEFKICFGN